MATQVPLIAGATGDPTQLASTDSILPSVGQPSSFSVAATISGDTLTLDGSKWFPGCEYTAQLNGTLALVITNAVDCQVFSLRLQQAAAGGPYAFPTLGSDFNLGVIPTPVMPTTARAFAHFAGRWNATTNKLDVMGYQPGPY